MATMTISMPEPMRDWVEARTRTGEYASVSDYLRDLIRRDRERREKELTIDDLRGIIADAKAGGLGARSLDDIFAEARRRALPGEADR